MRALLEKDLRLLLTRKSTLLIFLIIGVVFTWSFSASFSGAYLTVLGTMLALSTISYDDADNCMAYLFTLPCTRKQYVMEKYLFVYGVALLAECIGFIIVIVVSIAKGNAVNEVMLMETLASGIPILVITGGLMIPLQLKYGPEKSRIVFLEIIGVIFIIGFMIRQNAYAVAAIERIGKLMEEAAAGALVGMAVVLVCITAISFLVTSKIMKNKEF